jgi:hypothetical protein
MENDNDSPFEKLDLESLFNVRQWLRAAVEAKGANVTGAGIGVKGDFGMADIDIEIDGFRFNIEIVPRGSANQQKTKTG